MDAIEMQNAVMNGVARYVEWRREFLKNWQEAAAKGQLRMAFQMIPPQMKEAMKKADPQIYEQVAGMLEKR